MPSYSAKAGRLWGFLTRRLVSKQKRGLPSQCGALCWREVGGRKEVLLITSRESGRWIIPKGWPMKGKTLAEAAAQEAWEEAGVRGVVHSTSVGRFRYVKRPRSLAATEVEVTVFPLHVHEEHDDFPERGEREKMWVAPRDAAQLVDNPSLRALLASFG
ncbi:NUDIX hydrolase [Falsirhodobacter sp. 20TX0035]|nr:NUDIX hydrolase [Falsirhodobacter sp. 20TX0035]MDB6454813.1 NUDIX hydrolase [Falsirhodobacter sp. 20TX0035]